VRKVNPGHGFVRLRNDITEDQLDVFEVGLKRRKNVLGQNIQ